MRAFSLALGMLADASTAGLAQSFVAGEETSMEVAGLENPVVIYLPVDFEPGRRWPVVFHYHGTNGLPNVGVPRAYTGGRGFVLAGMDYRVRGTPKSTAAYYEGEVAILRSVLGRLREELPIDPERIYLGGFSKGGWFAATMGESYLKDELAGIYVLGAGTFPHRVRPPQPSQRPRMCYIGVGQLEINFPYGVRAIRHFSGLGFDVTFEGYPGLEHEVPMGRNAGADPFQRLAPGFLQWWQTVLHRDHAEALREPVQVWYEGVGERVLNERLPARDRYLVVHEGRRAPFYGLLSKAQRVEWERWMTALAQAPEVRREREAQSACYAVVEREVRAEEFGALLEIVRAYDEVRRTHPGTYHGALAGLSAERVAKQLRDLDRWRFDSAEQRARVEAELADRPLPEVPVKELLALMRESLSNRSTR